jgi:hypothetical protein
MSGWLKEPSGVFLVGVDSPLSFIFNYKEALQDINRSYSVEYVCKKLEKLDLPETANTFRGKKPNLLI